VKKIGERVIRGRVTPPAGETIITDGTEKVINVFDGDYTTAVRVTKFEVSTGDQSHQDFSSRLSTEAGIDTGIDDFIDYGDNRQIAWAHVNGSTDLTITDHYSLVSRDNLVMEDLVFTVRTASANISALNYYIEVDIYKLEPYQGSLTIVQNKSQG
jgi:hypothetical protein